MNSPLPLFVFSVALASVCLAADPATPVTHVDPAAAQKLIEEGKVIVLDVRSPEEYGDGHIEGAKNIDFTESDFEEKAAALDRSKSYLVHCAAGGRSTRSLPVLKELGFTSLYHLDGGFSAWEESGKPVAKKTP